MTRLEDELQLCQTEYAVDLRATNPNITTISSALLNGYGKLMGVVVLIGAYNGSKIKSMIQRYQEQLERFLKIRVNKKWSIVVTRSYTTIRSSDIYNPSS